MNWLRPWGSSLSPRLHGGPSRRCPYSPSAWRIICGISRTGAIANSDSRQSSAQQPSSAAAILRVRSRSSFCTTKVSPIGRGSRLPVGPVHARIRHQHLVVQALRKMLLPPTEKERRNRTSEEDGDCEPTVPDHMAEQEGTTDGGVVGRHELHERVAKKPEPYPEQRNRSPEVASADRAIEPEGKVAIGGFRRKAAADEEKSGWN